MRIAIDIRALLDPWYSGVQEYTLQLIRALIAVAPHHEYHLFYNALSGRVPSFRPAIVHGFRYPNKFFNAIQGTLGLPRWDRLLGRRIGGHVDCFFSPSLRLLPTSPTIPVVVTAHDLSFVRHPEFYSWRRRLWHAFMRPRQLVRRAAAVVAVSWSTAYDVQALFGVPAERVHVVHSGVPSDLVRPPPSTMAAVRAHWRLPEHFVLYLGTLEPRKNIETLIRAYSAIAAQGPQDLVIAGARGWLTQAIDRAIATSPARARIHLLGFVPPAHKAALLAAADLFVYPSFYEGFGFPPLEALLVGTPVLVANNSALPEVVGEWATLVDPYAPGEVALVMRELLRDLPVVSPAVIQAVRERYRWEVAARHTERVLVEAAGR